jgi:hypothetical protein
MTGRRSVPFGILALTVSAEAVGLGLTFISISEFELHKMEWQKAAFLLSLGLLDMIAGIGFFLLRKWAWWWAIANIGAFTVVGWASAIIELPHRSH